MKKMIMVVMIVLTMGLAIIAGMELTTYGVAVWCVDQIKTNPEINTRYDIKDFYRNGFCDYKIDLIDKDEDEDWFGYEWHCYVNLDSIAEGVKEMLGE